MDQTTFREFVSGWRQALGLQTWYAAAAAGAMLLAFCFAFFFLALTLTNPVLDQHEFRQAQTAINVYYAVHEGAAIAYETPVLGLPWSAPFEAPIYQTFVAVLAETGLPIEVAGRLIGFAFLIGTIYFAGLIIRMILPRDRLVSLLFAILVLTSPIYLFWGRTVLVETCALFFGTAWLYLAIRASRRTDLQVAALAAPLCILAALAKATTWPAFIVAFGLFWIIEWHRSAMRLNLVTVVLGAGAIAALAAGLGWVEYADSIKETGTVTRQITSAALSGWNYGSLADRISSQFWFDILPGRMLPDTLGWLWLIVLAGLAFLKPRSRYFVAAVACIVLFFVPLALFTNLHLVHNYYQSANALFLIAAAAIVFAGLIERGYVTIALLAACLLIVGQFVRFFDYFWPQATQDMRARADYQVAHFVKDATPPGSALVVFGNDWSPVVHFYAERKGLAVPNWLDKTAFRLFVSDPKTLFGTMPVGAVVVCGDNFGTRPDMQQITQMYLRVIAREASAGGMIKTIGHCTAFIGPPRH